METRPKRSRSLNAVGLSAREHSNFSDDAVSEGSRPYKRHQPEVSSTMRLSMTPDRSPVYEHCKERFRASPMEITPTKTHSTPISPSASYSLSSLQTQENDSRCVTGRSRSNAFRSPRQKPRHRLSPLKGSQPYSKPQRHSLGSGTPSLSRLAAAVEARETMPPSPNDKVHPRDLRKTALLRSVAQRLEVGGISQPMTPDGSRPPPLRTADWSEGDRVAPGFAKGARETPYTHCDDLNLGAAFSSLGFASPGLDRRKLPRPRLTKHGIS